MNGKFNVLGSCATATALMIGFVTVAAAAPAPAVAPAAVAPSAAAALRIIVIDRNLLMQRSLAGRDIAAQVQNLLKQAETQFGGEEAALQTEANTLQQQLAILAPDVRDQKEKDFRAKEQSLQTRAQQRQADIQAALAKAEQQFEMALEPIVVDIMREKGALMTLDRTAVVISSSDMDVTQLAMQQLDKKLPHVKVDLVAGAGVVPGAAPAAGPARAGAPAAAAAAPARPAAPATGGK